jgi:transcriptional regulator with XRE-family HTH domain
MPRRRRLAERRKAVGLSQESLAEQVGVDRSTVVRWERGDTGPQPWHRPKLADALRVSVDELAQMLADHGEPPSPSVPGHHSPLQDSLIDHLAAAQSLRLADRQLGGGYLYAAVTSYLERTVGPRLFGSQTDADDHDVFDAAAALTEMAGWMAHDAGRDARAEQHMRRAHALARLSRDQQLGSHILASLSHLASHAGRAEAAVAYALQGHEILDSGHDHPTVRAHLFAMEARARAALPDQAACHAALDGANEALASGGGNGLSPWISPFDEASLAIESARCFQSLGQLDAARQQLERVVTLRQPDRVRSRAFGQLMLVPILLARGRPDEACIIAHQVLDATGTLSSYLVAQQLERVGQLLAAQRRSSEAAALLGRLREELGRRRWLSQWLSAGPDPLMS